MDYSYSTRKFIGNLCSFFDKLECQAQERSAYFAYEMGYGIYSPLLMQVRK